MASPSSTPILTVDVALIHQIDTQNVENLFSMWRVFSRCSRTLKDGRRLENLSWRVWTRETFCCRPVFGANATTPAISIASRSSEDLYVPVSSLSGSVDSLADELGSESDQTPSTTSISDPLDVSRSQIQRQHSVNSRTRGRERHITPDHLEKMVITIKEKKDLEPITLNIHPYSPPAAITVSLLQEAKSAAIAPSTPDSVASGASERRTTIVVRGFSPSHVNSSCRSIPLLTAPSSIPTADIAAANTSQGPQPQKRVPMFALGESSGDDSLSEQAKFVENDMKLKKKAIFSFGGSSNEDENSLPAKLQKPQSALANKIQRPLVHQKKQTSFQEVVIQMLDDQRYSDDVFETDEEDVDESAIDDDDDSSDWEDSIEESGSIDGESFFQRIDSRPCLTTRRSLITTMIHQADRAAALATPALQRLRTPSPNGPSLAASPDSDDGSLMMKKTNLKPIAEIPRSSGPAPQPIIRTTSNKYHQQLAVSPRTTRRNMLAAELTASLRQHLLWERQQKSQTANAVLKRRHTAHDVAKLKQYPDKVHMGDNGGEIHASWNQYFSTGLGEYHSRGW